MLRTANELDEMNRSERERGKNRLRRFVTVNRMEKAFNAK